VHSIPYSQSDKSIKTGAENTKKNYGNEIFAPPGGQEFTLSQSETTGRGK